MRVFVFLLVLGACSPQPDEQANEAAAAAPPTVAPGDADPVARQAALMSVPKDPEAVKKLQAMGYNVHDDHLHAPGVSACPKMGDDPIM